LKPYPQFVLRWSWPAGLPVGTAAPKDEHGTIRLETQNVPAFLIEDYMPPENELKMRVDFSYSEDALEQDQAKFWKKEGKEVGWAGGRLHRKEESAGASGSADGGGERYAGSKIAEALRAGAAGA